MFDSIDNQYPKKDVFPLRNSLKNQLSTPMPKCKFNKAAWEFPSKFTAYFQNNLSLELLWRLLFLVNSCFYTETNNKCFNIPKTASVFLVVKNRACQSCLSNLNGSSRTEVFCKKFILGNFGKFTGKHLCQSLFFNKVASRGLQLY